MPMMRHSHSGIFHGGIFLFAIAATVLIFPAGQAHAISINFNIPEQYTTVTAGERVYFEVSVLYPENPVREDLHFEYDVVAENGETIAQSEVLKAVENQLSFMDYIVVPQSGASGLYNLKIKVSDYAQLNEDVSASFNVAAQNNQLVYYFIALLVAIISVGIFIGIEIKNIVKHT
jgi:hypothetical protein